MLTCDHTCAHPCVHAHWHRWSRGGSGGPGVTWLGSGGVGTMTQDGVFSVRGTAAPDPSPQGGSSIRSCRAAGPRVSEGCLEPLGKQPGAAWPPGACAALPEEGPPCRGPSGTTVFMAGLGVAWLLCKPGFICLSPVGQAACVSGSGLSHPRLLAFCLEPKTVPLLLARPEVVLRAPGSCGIAWGLLGLGRDWGRPRHPCPPGPPGHRLWLQVSCPLAAGPHVLFLPLSGLANHGQTRHMVRGRASGTSPHTCAQDGRSRTAPLAAGVEAGPVCLLPCFGVQPGVKGAARSPRGAPLTPPLATGTKPEPSAQWEVLPHQSAPDPRGLPAPRQATEDELDRRPRRRVLHGHRRDQVGASPRPRASRGAAAAAASPVGPALSTGKSASCYRPRRPSALPAGPTSPSPCARAKPCRCGRPRRPPSTTSPSSSRTRRPAAPRGHSDHSPRPRPPPARPPPGFGSAPLPPLQRSCSFRTPGEEVL